MSIRTTLAISTLAVMAAFSLPAPAAAESTSIKVALTDISSATSTGMSGARGRYGMMGERFGGGMMGGGMMGGGLGGHGPGGPGTWQMGPGMMMAGGMMAIRINQSTVKAGEVHFDVTNWSRSVLHEMLVVAVDNPDAALPYDPIQGRVPENQIKTLGETKELRPNESETLSLKLTPGTYLLLCNVPGHYAYGMYTALTVTP